MNQKQLEKKVKHWQKVLKLDHWDIKARLVDYKETDNRDGVSYIQWEYLVASVLVVDPKLYTGELYDRANIDEVICHELMHCHMAGFETKDGSYEAKLEEQLVETMSRVIVRGYKNKKVKQ